MLQLPTMYNVTPVVFLFLHAAGILLSVGKLLPRILRNTCTGVIQLGASCTVDEPEDGLPAQEHSVEQWRKGFAEQPKM